MGALRAGATGYVLKERDDIEVSLSIRSVLRGGAPIDPFIARRILEMLPVPTPVTCAVEPENQHPALTEREQPDSCGWWPMGCPTARSPISFSCRATRWRATLSASIASWQCRRAPALCALRVSGE